MPSWKHTAARWEKSVDLSQKLCSGLPQVAPLENEYKASFSKVLFYPWMLGKIILKLDQILHKAMKVFCKSITALCKGLEQEISRGPSQSKLFHDSLTEALVFVGVKVPAAQSSCPPAPGTNSPSMCGDSPDVSRAVVTHLNSPYVDWSLLRATEIPLSSLKYQWFLSWNW